MGETYTLSEPLKVAGGGLVTELRLREPIGMEMLRANKHIEVSTNPEAEMLFARELVAGVAGLKRPDLLSDLPVSDLVEASDIIVRLFSEQVEGFNPDEAELELPIGRTMTIDGIDYSTLSLRPARTGEMLKARGRLRHGQGPASQLEYQMSLVSNVTGLALPIVHQLPASAIVRAAATIEIFTQPGRRTGTT